MESKFVEDQTLIFSNFKDGPSSLGDLWNCQESRRVGTNIFGKNIKEDNLHEVLISSLEYTLDHAKNTKKENKRFKISGELSLDFLAKLVKLNLSGDYGNESETNSEVEELLCEFYKETYSIEVINLQPLEEAIEKINNQGVTKATHVVEKIILGGELTASIKITSTSTSNDLKTTASGNFGINSKLPFGKQLDANTKALLENLLDKNEKNFVKRINFKSRPDSPHTVDTIEKMFKVIDSFGERISKEIFIQINGKQITGVPLKYHLVPIGPYLKNRQIKIEKLYLSIEDKVQKRLLEVLAKYHDLQTGEYNKNQILGKDSKIKIILSDPTNPYSGQIKSLDNELKTEYIARFEDAVNTFKLYKEGKVQITAIEAIIEKFDNDIIINEELEVMVTKLLKEGQAEINWIRYSEIKDKSQVNIFTNEESIQSWFANDHNPKILLNSYGAKLSVFEIYKFVDKIIEKEIKLGIVLPNISKEFSLTISDGLECEWKFINDEVLFAINAFNAHFTFDETEKKAENQFFRYILNIIFKLNNHRVHSAEFKFVNLTESIYQLREYSFLVILDDFLNVRKIISTTKGQHVIVVPIYQKSPNAYDESVVKNVLECKKNFKNHNLYKNAKWVFGYYDVQQVNYFGSTCPNFYIFYDGKCKEPEPNTFNILLLGSMIISQILIPIPLYGVFGNKGDPLNHFYELFGKDLL